MLVLERGRRYAPGDFPRDPRDLDALLWRHRSPARSRGLFEFRTHSGIATITAAGVGGGSLVYASIHYRPHPTVFDDPRWPRAFTPESLEPYYQRVEKELAVQTTPVSLPLPKRDAFHAAARSLGRDSMDTPQAVSWETVHGASAELRAPCRLCCECEFGCNHGAKNTLDFTYLADAEALGAQVSPGYLISHLSPGDRGGWRVHATDLDTGRSSVVTGRRVVVAAGSLGTTELLLRSRDLTRTLPRLPHRLGRGYSGNGDFLGNVQNAAVRLDPWWGPDVTSVMRFDDDPAEPRFVLATPTFNQPVITALAAQGQPPTPEWVTRIAPALWHRLPGLLGFAFASGVLARPPRRPAIGAGPADRFTTIFAIGRDNARGRMVLRDGRLDILWDYAGEHAALIARQREAMQALTDAYGGTYSDFPLYKIFGRTTTVHNLGGCALSEDPERGVVDVDGQVHGHPGLFVADGSVLPTAIGSHPAMTIAAVSEWIADRVAA